ALQTAHENGVNIRLSLNTNPENEADLPTETALARTCTEARHRPLPSPFLAIIDRTQVCFAPHARSMSQYGVLVDDRTHAYVFHWYFLSCLWEIFEPIHSTRPTSPPIRYVDIRECIRDLEPLLGESTVEAHIEGHDTETGEEYDLHGTIVDTFYTGDSIDEQAASLVQLAGRATLTLDDGIREYTIGGWGAILEPIEATTITIESLSAIC
ncbi:MAG TPA: TrmB family transcriptional regulator sugar-binding domain-containing protein, partial [Halococcus sp.]|nr:TrmB family transcriptional regulator sugar-binding domain-containing protein [Halococcus sp.]